jgi:aldose 1-epimerase
MIKIGFDKSNEARISLRGAFVQSLTLDGVPILYMRKDRIRWCLLHGGSCVLIPYVDLVKNATYFYHGQRYFLPKNGKPEGDSINSIHGLVLNKNWELMKQTVEGAVLNTTLVNSGYPSKLKIQASYSIRDRLFTTRFRIRNIGKHTAPLMCGAHPYFIFTKWWELKCSKPIKHIKKYDSDEPEITTEDCSSINSHSSSKLDEYYEGGGDLRLLSEDREIEIRRTNMPFFGVYNGIYAGQSSVNIKVITSAPNCFNNKYGVIDIKPNQIINCGFTLRLIH